MRLARAASLAALSVVLCGGGPEALVRDDQIVGDAIPNTLSDSAGDAVRGQSVFVRRDSGHCVLCHAVGGLDAPFQGDVGPDLSDVGARFSAGQIRLRIADASRLNPETVMPPYYRVHGLNQVGRDYKGKPVLSAQQIEDLVAYLADLKG